MRQMISGLVAVAAMVAASAAPAMACGGLFTGNGCSPCQTVSPCAQGYYRGAGYGIAAYERLPSPTQYYYVNQGPTYTGPGNFAPVPTYQESAVSGWNAYSRPYYYGYDGGRYANPMHHYYDGARVSGPVVYNYRWHRHHRYWRQPRPYYGMHRHSLRYGHAPRRYSQRFAAPHVIYGSRHDHHGQSHRTLRRYH
jgi:hypothetical protein